MEAAFRGSLLHYTVYEGFIEQYPRWFRNEIVDHTYVDEFGHSVYNLDVLVEGWDIFMKNRYGDVRRVNREEFDSYYIEVSKTQCAPRDAVLECFIYSDDDGIQDMPYWMLEALQDSYIYKEYSTWWFVGSEGEIPMDPEWVILRNEYGDIKYTPKYIFDKQFQIVK